MRIFLFLLLMCFVSCCDIIEQKENDISKYEYLTPFILKDQKYIGGSLNIDTSELTYSYEVQNIQTILNRINEKAIADDWKETGNNIYEKKVYIYPDSYEKIRVSVIIKNKMIIMIVH